MASILRQVGHLALCAFSSATTFPAAAQSAASPKPGVGYSIHVFARGEAGKYTAPDSLEVANGHIFIGYGNGIAPDGSDGKTSNIIEYTQDGQVVHVYTVLGHNDGLKLDPDSKKLYATQNEDAHPNLVIIDPTTRAQTTWKFASEPLHGGGYDDMVFRNHRLFLSCSNPSHNPNAEPALVEVFSYAGGMLHTTETYAGDAVATNVITGKQVKLNLQDPDSMTIDPEGDIVHDSQADSELVTVVKPGASDQQLLVLPLSSPFGTPQADDTIFVTGSQGFLLVADTPNNVVYKITKTAFAPGVAYTAAVGAPSSSGVSEGFVGRLDLDSGYLTPIVTGLGSPHGMVFVPTPRY